MEEYFSLFCLGREIAILCFRKRFTSSFFGDGACDSLFLLKILSEFVWGRCLRFLVSEDVFQVSLGTVLAIPCFGGVLLPSSSQGDGACDSVFLKNTPSKFVWGALLAILLFLKKIRSKFGWLCF